MSRHSEYKRCNKPNIEYDTNYQLEYGDNYIVHDCALFSMHARCHARRRVTLSTNDIASRLLSAIAITKHIRNYSIVLHLSVFFRMSQDVVTGVLSRSGDLSERTNHWVSTRPGQKTAIRGSTGRAGRYRTRIGQHEPGHHSPVAECKACRSSLLSRTQRTRKRLKRRRFRAHGLVCHSRSR